MIEAERQRGRERPRERETATERAIAKGKRKTIKTKCANKKWKDTRRILQKESDKRKIAEIIHCEY